MYDKARRNFGFWDSGLFVAKNANQGMICRDADCLLGYAGPLDQQGDVQRNAALAPCTILEYPRTPFSLFSLFLFHRGCLPRLLVSYSRKRWFATGGGGWMI